MSNGNGGMSIERSVVEGEKVLKHLKVISSFCSADKPQCVEVEVVSGTVVVTDSKDGIRSNRPSLVFTKEEWDAFILGAKNGEFDYERLTSLVAAS